jgi:putative DNA primase/helicase
MTAEYSPPDPRLDGKVNIQKLELRSAKQQKANGETTHPELIAAKTNIAVEPDKLRTIQNEALRLSSFVTRGEIAKLDAFSVLHGCAALYGVNRSCRPDELERIINDGLSGRATLPPPVGSPDGAGRQDARRKDELVTVCAKEIEPKRIEWFWLNRFARGKVGLLGGHPDEGKSLILTDMLARATRGDDYPCGEGRAPIGNVILLTAEDDLNDTVIPRLMAAGAVLGRVHIVKMVKKADGRSRTFSLLTDMEMLEQTIVKIGSVVAVGIDPVSAYFGVGKMDSYRTTDVRGVMAPLATLAQKHNLAIVGTLHFNKNINVTNAMLRFSDSLAFVAAARHAFVVMKDPDNEGRRLFLKAKNNLAVDSDGLAYSFQAPVVATDATGDLVAPCIAWSSQRVRITATEALAAAIGGNDEPTATDDTVDFLRIALADGPLPVKEVERQAVEAGLLGEGKPVGQSKPFRNARKMLGIVTDKGGMREGWTWALPKMPSKAEDAL